MRREEQSVDDADALDDGLTLEVEPDIVELRLEPGAQALLRLVHPPDRAHDAEVERFRAEASARAVALAFWRALRRLEGALAANGPAAWRFESPNQAVSRLGDVLNTRRG